MHYPRTAVLELLVLLTHPIPMYNISNHMWWVVGGTIVALIQDSRVVLRGLGNSVGVDMETFDE